MNPPEGHAFYLFYLARATPFPQELAGVGDSAGLVVYRAGDLTAVLAPVSVEEFCGPQAESNLGDLGWIGERAIRHEQVVEHGARGGPVLPARLGTLFSSLPVLDRFIVANRAAIARFLDGVEGQQEWGIKLLVERKAAQRWLAGAMAAAEHASTPTSAGLRYLEQRRHQAQAEKGLTRWVREECESIAGGLDEFVSRRRSLGVTGAAAAESQGEVILNLAVLVELKRSADLRSHIEKLNRERDQQGLRLMLCGPWPPYSFCPSLTMPR